MDSDTIARPYLGAAVMFFAFLILYTGLVREVWNRWRTQQASWLAISIAAGGPWWLGANILVACFSSVLERPHTIVGSFLFMSTYSLLYVLAPAIRQCLILRVPSNSDREDNLWLLFNYLPTIPCLGLLWTSTLSAWRAEDLVTLLLLLSYLIVIYREVGHDHRRVRAKKNHNLPLAEERPRGIPSLRVAIAGAAACCLLGLLMTVMARWYSGKAQYFLIVGWKSILPYPLVLMALAEVSVLKSESIKELGR